MRVYRRNPRTGFIEQINTDGSFVPKGWSTTKSAANKRKNGTKVLHGRRTNKEVLR